VKQVAWVAVMVLCVSCSRRQEEPPKVIVSTTETERLTLLAAYEENLMEDLLRAFLADRPGVEVKTIRAAAGKLMDQILKPGGAEPADVVIGLPQENLETLARRGALGASAPSACADIPAEYRDPGGTWVGLTISALAFGVNERLLEQKQLPAPHRWEDLTRPQYRGWVVIGRPQESRATRLALRGVLSLMHPRGWDYWKRLDRNLFAYTNKPWLTARHVGSGEALIAVDLDRYLLREKREGKRVRLFYPKPTFYLVEGMALLKGAPQAKTAEAFLSWACGLRAMRLLESSRTGVTRPFVEPSEPWKARLTQVKFHTPVQPLSSQQILAEWERRYGK
jgi:iron(III) transport system substrate-binding protein